MWLFNYYDLLIDMGFFALIIYGFILFKRWDKRDKDKELSLERDLEGLIEEVSEINFQVREALEILGEVRMQSDVQNDKVAALVDAYENMEANLRSMKMTYNDTFDRVENIHNEIFKGRSARYPENYDNDIPRLTRKKPGPKPRRDEDESI